MISGHKRGYTMVETMIFISVSSLLFFSAMTAIGGRQQQVQFTQAVRGFDAQLRDILNDVSTGFFPGSSNVTCTITPGANATTRPALSAVAPTEDAEQGTSENCIFVGKAIQFAPREVNVTDANNSSMLVHTLVGRRTTPDPERRDVASIEEANPVTVAPTSVTDPLPNFSSNIVFDWGMRVNRVAVPDGVGGYEDVGTIGVFNTFSDTQAADPIADSQVVDVAPITNTRIGQDSSYDAVAILNTITDGDTPLSGETRVSLNPENGIVLCLSDPDQERRASITILSNNRRVTTVVSLDSVDPAC